MAKRKIPTLEEFAAADSTRTGSKSYIDTLPADVREQLLRSSAGHAAATRWLRSLGYERATQNMVAHWRNNRLAMAA